MDSNESFTGGAAAQAKEIAELRQCLRSLVDLKYEKDQNGKTEHYQEQMPLAWAEARRLLGDDGPGLIRSSVFELQPRGLNGEEGAATVVIGSASLAETVEMILKNPLFQQVSVQIIGAQG